MAWFKRGVDAFAICVLFPIVLLLLGSIAIAVSVQALLIYVGALLAAWLFTAFGFSLVTGAMTLGEIADGFRSQRRSERLYEGEPLPRRRLRFPNLRRVMKPAEIVDDFRPRRRSDGPYDGGQSLPEPYSETF
jgi:hypothetical protein